MGSSGSFDFNLTNVANLTNNSVRIGEEVIEELAGMGDIIGIGIAISVSMGLIAMGILVVIGIPFLIIKKVKGYKGA